MENLLIFVINKLRFYYSMRLMEFFPSWYYPMWFFKNRNSVFLSKTLGCSMKAFSHRFLMVMRWVVVFILLAVVSNFASAAAWICPAAPAGVKNITANNYYVDSSHSIVDPVLFEQNKASLTPLYDYLDQVTLFTDQYVFNANTDQGLCALVWLNRWAKDSALLGRMIGGTQPEYERKSLLIGLTLNYLKVKRLLLVSDRGQVLAAQQDNIESWLKKLADEVWAFSYVDTDPVDRNNHYYWAGLSQMAVGVTTGNSEFIDRARQTYYRAMTDMQDTGELPKEMARGSRALIYHNYALVPLIYMAELAKDLPMPENWYNKYSGKVHVLANLVLNGLTTADGLKFFQQRAGFTQDIPSKGVLGWVEFYRRVNPSLQNDPRIAKILQQAPFRDSKLAGNISGMASINFFTTWPIR